MKRTFTLILSMVLAFTINAQYIYNDFDENQNETFVGWPNNPEVVANPDASGINTSANVAKWQRSTEQWAHVSCELDGKIDFSTGTAFTMKVHSPIACTILFKLEDKNNGGVFTELSTDLTSINEWTELIFDFSDGQSDMYDKIVIFFDFSSTSDTVFYFDDIEGPEYGGGGVDPKPLLAIDVQDNFENDGWGTITTWKFQDPDLVDLPITTDPDDETNHVAEYNRSGNFEWTNAQFVLDHRMDLSTRNQFKVNAYFPSTNDYTGDLTPTLALKLQNSLMGGNAWMTQTEVILTVEEFDTWVDLNFDFSQVADSVNYDQIVVQFGGEGHFVPGMFYFDDFYLEDPSNILEASYEQLEMYPNPAVNYIEIINASKISRIAVYSIDGKKLIQSENIDSRLDVSTLNKGLYFVIVEDTKGSSFTGKFMKN